MIDAMIKSAILFAVVAIVTRLLKRRSPASLRHLLWSFAIVGALAIPLLSRVTPFKLGVLPSTAAPSSEVGQVKPRDAAVAPTPASPSAADAVDDAVVDEETSRPAVRKAGGFAADFSWTRVFATVWGLGVIILLGRLLIGLAVVRRIARRGVEITDPQWAANIDRAVLLSGVRQPVEVRMSDGTPVPYTCGLMKPTIVLPTSASEWTAERRDAVLMHELAHINRGDLAMNILSHVARAMYWPNPLAWMAANGLRFEGERACDDAVLRAGARASDYADHLLDIVKSVGRPIPNVALAMARSSDFEGRLLAILEPGVPRTRLGRARTAAIATVFAAALVPLSAMTSASTAAALPASPSVTLEQPQVSEEPTPKQLNTAPLPQASSTVAALADALGDATPAVRLAAVNSLGALQDPAAIAALAKALREDTDARVREAAAWALGEIDDNRAVPHLLEALKSERATKVRVKIVEALNQIDDPAAVSGVAAVLKDPSAEVRRAAVDALGEFEDHSATAALIGLIRDEDLEVRRKVAEALGQMEDANAVDALTAMVRDSDPEVRANAIEALHHFESQKLIPVFVAALKDSSAHVREHAADALGSIDGLHTAPRALIDALADQNRDVRRNVVSALSNIGDEAAVPALKKLIAETDASTKRSAVEALKEIGGAEAMQAIMGLLKDADPEVRKLAAEALGKKR